MIVPIDSTQLTSALTYVVAAGYPLAAFWAGGHALLNARDPRAAWGWIAVCLLFPLAGALLYYLFGINRVRRRARTLLDVPAVPGVRGHPRTLPPIPDSFQALSHTGDVLTGRPALSGNRIEALFNGEQSYPAMLEAIANAKHSVWLASYIFRNDATGKRFMRALAEAVQRGVTVRVLIDGIGAVYGLSFPVFWLRRHGVRAERFLPPRLIPPMLHINLRNHRKLLVVDGETAFTGGLNIAEYHIVSDATVRKPVVDVHFRIRGPVVDQLARSFADDWRMAAGETLVLHEVPAAETEGAIARLITDGPDDDLDKLAFMILAAVGVAQRSVRIMTPYFLPSPELTAALQAAALRGVEVTIVLPARSNLRFVDWATQNMLQPLLSSGVRIIQQPPPFAHSKLFVIDEHYVQLGTANIDPRSLRLNFELAVETYDHGLAAQLVERFHAVERRGRQIEAAALKARSLPVRLRDAFFWLFSSYL
ncbi:phospholipase D-like domain-containing protein [Algiphilus sp.]|uniref:phospholipase D-like domain-containing protein n=1 Tax=Algiphilus sp. TaxID=1872431 RepID=UPI003BA9617C